MSPEDGFYYTIKYGDTLSGIAARFGVPKWQMIYYHGKNGKFREKRPDPSVIYPGDVVWIPAARPNRRTIPTGKITKFKTRLTAIVLTSLTFNSDHGLMKDNDSDWTKSGSNYSEPEWEAGSNHPISHNMEKNLEATASFEMVSVNESPQFTAEVKGVSGQFIYPTLLGSGDFKPGTVPVNVVSENPLPNVVQKFPSIFMAWQVDTGTKTMVSGISGAHIIYITLGDPIDEGVVEDGVTLKRMDKAVDWVGDANTNDPVEIIDHLFGKFPSYALSFGHLPPHQKAYLDSHPDEKQKLEDAGFADYMKDDKGGAWPLAQYKEYSGECQAIVRLIRGIKNQVGCPGKAEVKYVNANAPHQYKAIIKDVGTSCGGPDPTRTYALVDDEVEVGRLYTMYDVGWNNYEAYMKFSLQEPGGRTKIVWFGGGIGKVGEVYEDQKEEVKKLEKSLVCVFWALVEVVDVFHEGTWKMRVTEIWKYD